jgi:oligopeptide transport system substrate-binding protein
VRWFVLALAACSLPDGDYFGAIPEHVEPRQFRWCNQAEPDHLDPALASSTVSSPLVWLLFDGLTTFGMDGLPVPSLATHWESSEDLRTFTFHLRDNARWSNGRPVTAYDVAFTAIRVLFRPTASPNADHFAPVDNATAWFTRRVYSLRRDVSPYRAGDVVEVTAADAPDLDVRTASRPLALRDLGADSAVAYATVPAGTEVELVMTSGARATLPSPGGVRWAYVYWARDLEGVFGWVPASELGEPRGGDVIEVRGKDKPAVKVAARDLSRSTDLIGIEVPDAHTIVFRCTDPTPYFLTLSNNRGMRTTPIETVSRWPRSWTRPERIVTSGPMHLASWIENDRIELVRSPTYWNPGEVKLDRLTAFAMADQAAATNFYFTGGCDALATNQIPSAFLPALNGEQRRAYKDYIVSPYLGVYFLWLNTKAIPNRHLRRALAYAIDRTQIPRFTHGNEIPSAQLTAGAPIRELSPQNLAACGVARETPGVALVMTAGELCYVPPPGLDYDPAAAKREADAARSELGAGFPSVLHYRYNAGSEAHKQIAEYLQASWAKVGITVELEAQEWNALLDDTHAGKFEIVRFGGLGTVADPESEFLFLFRCDSPDNRGRYCNPAFERLMDEARPLADRKARNAKLRDAEAVMIEDAPVIPLYVYTQKHLVKPYVRDLAINLIDQPPLWRVWLDPDWKR